jgi:tetratricopeptide (TPR) repeat protein
MYEKSLACVEDDPESIEDLADIFYEIGNELCDKKHFELAAKWLERAFDAVDNQEVHRLSDDAGDLKLTILQKLGRLGPNTDCLRRLMKSS